MAPKACYWTTAPEPGSVTERAVGTTFDVILGLKNCGSTHGTFYCEIQKEGVVIAHQYYKELDPNRTSSFIHASVAQPSRDVAITFVGGHMEENAPVQDFSERAILRPKPTVVKCTQNFKIVDESGSGIWNAKIELTNDTTKTGYTDTFGRWSRELTKNVRYSYTISAAGYVDSFGSFPAGVDDPIRIVLKGVPVAPPPETCAQSVLVRKKNTSNIYLRGVNVEARPSTGSVVRCVTGSKGKCNLNLTKSKVYDILISPGSSGYTCERTSDCEKRGVTACGAEIELFLTGEAEYPGAARWKSIDSGVWAADKYHVVFEYEVENPDPEKLDGSCRYSYRGFARWGTKTAEGRSVSACGPRTNTISLWSVAPGSNIEIRLDRFDLKDHTWLRDIDRETVTIPEKEVPVGNKITVTVGASFDLSQYNIIKCGEVVSIPTFPIPGQITWIPKPIGYDVCQKDIPSSRVVEFTAADGLVEGHHYVFTIYPITWLDQVVNESVFEFKGTKTWTIENVTFIHKPICQLLGIPPESPECKDEVGMFIDPIYAYDTLNRIFYHRDMHGNPAEPETLDYVILPMVVAGSLVPMPIGKGTKLLSQMSGRLAKAANTVIKKKFLVTHQKMIHQLAAVGDDVNLRTFWDNFELGKLSTCENILKQAAEAAGRSDANRVLMRTNIGKWVKGIRAKWKSTPSLKTKIDDLEMGGDGNIFKSFESTISSHFDDAAKAGDWKKAHGIYHSAAMSVDDMTYLEHNLAKFTPEFRRMHNIMRYGNDDFIKFLKTEKAVVPEFANRFDEGVDYIIRHIGEETGQEASAYKAILDGIPESEVSAIVSNLSGTGKSAAAAVTHVLKTDATKGMGAFYSAAAKGIEKGKKLSRKEQKAVAASLKTKIDDAAKTMTPAEKVAMEGVLETDDIVKHPKLARLWKYIRGAESAQRFRDFPLWKKAAVIGGAFIVVDLVWKRMMDFCMALFLGEETIQWAGFGGIVLNSLTYDWDEKPLSERKKLIEVFTEFKTQRQKIHDVVVKGSTIFETLCLPFAHIYQNFWEADSISIGALGTKIEYMEKGIDPLSGLGECTLIAQADKGGVAFYVHGETKKHYSGAAFSKVYIPGVIVREGSYDVVLCAEKDGYCLLMQKIRITEDNLDARKSTPLFNMVPDTEAGPNPFQGLPYTDTEYNALATKPEVVRFGKIICSTSPAGAKIYLDGVYKNALTNWTLEYVPIGKHTVVFKKDGYADCTVNVTVAVEPDAQAYCNFEGTEGAITFKCAHNDDYCTRGATIQYRRKGATTWETFGKKTSSYAVTKTDLEAGVYEVKYNLLNVMECQGEVTVKAGESVDFDMQLRSRLPTTVRTTVTAIVDGDGIRTKYTDNLSEFPPPATKYGHQEIRIVGFNAPECENYPTICAPDGKEAGDRLKELIPVGTEIELRIYEWLPLGHNNRIIAGVFKNGKDIAKEMLRSCLVTLTASKYFNDKYPWVKWQGEDSYEEVWCNPDETNVTISTYDEYGESYNVDVILFDNEIKSSAEGGVTIKNVTPGRHKIEIQDDMLKGEGVESLYSYVEPLNQSFSPCVFYIDVPRGETYRVKVHLGVKAGVPVKNVREITFSTFPISAMIHVDGKAYTHPGMPTVKIPIKLGEYHSIAFLATDYEPLNATILVSADRVSCLTDYVCGYKTKKPYILVAKDYVRAYLKSRVTASSFLYWMQMKGGGEGIGLDEIIDIVLAYKGKKDLGFTPTLDNLIDVVRYYKGNRP